MVTHPSTNRAQRRVTTLIDTLQRVTTKLTRHLSTYLKKKLLFISSEKKLYICWADIEDNDGDRIILL